MVYCCVGGCTNSQEKKSAYRHFLRFYPFPKKDKARMKQWVARVNRRPCDLNTNSMLVCSDHFADVDFEPSKFLESRLCYKKNMKIFLKEDAVPNTDRETGGKSDHKELNTESAHGSTSSTSRKKTRYNPIPAAIDDIIRENEEVLQTLNAANVQSDLQSELQLTDQVTSTSTDVIYEDVNSKSTQYSVKTKTVYSQTELR